jgi:hypothetical protein
MYVSVVVSAEVWQSEPGPELRSKDGIDDVVSSFDLIAQVL